MTTRDYGTASESKKPTTKIEEHDCSDCVYRMKKLNKNGGKIYVWFRIIEILTQRIRQTLKQLQLN